MHTKLTMGVSSIVGLNIMEQGTLLATPIMFAFFRRISSSRNL